MVFIPKVVELLLKLLNNQKLLSCSSVIVFTSKVVKFCHDVIVSIADIVRLIVVFPVIMGRQGMVGLSLLCYTKGLCLPLLELRPYHAMPHTCGIDNHCDSLVWQ